MAEPIEIFVALAELITEADVEAAATGALVDASGEELIGGGADLLMGTAEDGETFLEPIFDDAEVPLGPDDPLGPGDLGQVTKGQLHALWQDSKTFARWTGREIMKGALFETGMKVLEGELAKKPPAGVDLSGLQQVLGSTSSSLQTLTKIVNDWRKWAVKHFPNRGDYGMITAEGTMLFRFEIFRNKLAGLSTFLEKTLGPLLAKTGKAIDSANIGGLRAAVRTYADMILAIGTEIDAKEKLMMHAGLQDQEENIQKSRSLLD